MSYVLVVEDDVDLRESVVETLTHRGVRVVEAQHGGEALELLQQNPEASLVLLDLMMPVVDGWTFRARMLADKNLARVPVVVMSGVDRLSRAAQGLQAAEFLPKPFALDQLVQVVQRYGPRA